MDDLLGAIPSLIHGCTLRQIAEAHPTLVADLKKLDPVATAATFGGLLTDPRVQANCNRIESLVHLATAYCNGRSAVTQHFVSRAFKQIGNGYSGDMEDPSEDVFVSLVNTAGGNFRIFEGIREGTGFHLQRILNIVETMPKTPGYGRIAESIAALLSLSEEIARRSCVRENELGQEIPLYELPRGTANEIALRRSLIRFSDDDLASLRVNKSSLTPFVFDLSDRLNLLDQQLGNTDLERRPVAVTRNEMFVLLPTAIATAITCYVIDFVVATKMTQAFEASLAADIARLFYDTPVLGRHHRAPLKFQRINGGRIAAVMTKADPGRFLHLVFFVDGLEGFRENGLGGFNAAPAALSVAVNEHIKIAAQDACCQAEFKSGITLLVGCGYGRGISCEIENDLPPQWRLELLSAYDLITLSWLSEFDSLSLWRLLDAQEAIAREGLNLLNVNGFLNLVALSRELDGHLVPHGELPRNFSTLGAKSVLLVRQNAIRELRHGVLKVWNPRRVLDPDGRWVKVRKTGESEFEEDRTAPLYGSEEDVAFGKLRGVYVAPRRPWWIEVKGETEDRASFFEHWMMLLIWLRRAAPILDSEYANLKSSPMLIRVNFAEMAGSRQGMPRPKSEDELRALLKVSLKSDSHIEIDVMSGFDDGFAQPENIAERLLVEAIVKGAASRGKRA